MKKLKNFAQELWNDESGQGTAEYVLLLAIVAGVLIMFKGRIKDAIDQRMGDVEGQLSTVTNP